MHIHKAQERKRKRVKKMKKKYIELGVDLKENNVDIEVPGQRWCFYGNRQPIANSQEGCIRTCVNKPPLNCPQQDQLYSL